MTKETVKKGYELAEKELQEKQIEKVKDIVKDTLKRIKDLEEQIKELEDEKKILKLDLDDLKEGRLDRIEDRQDKDSKAKKVSVIKVIKEVHHHYVDRWYEPYKITYVPYYPASVPVNPVWCTTANDTLLLGSAGTTTTGYSGSSNTAGFANAVNAVFTLNGSVTKNNASGTYDLGNKVVHFR